MKLVKFAYADDFHCIGPECSDSCCKYWAITLGKREYLNYKKMDCSPELKSKIDSAFYRIKDGNDNMYAAMKLVNDTDCPFLDKDSLCMIQKEKGEQALSYTCKIFPRMIYRADKNSYVKLCTINCSHVAEMLIEHPEGLEIIETDYDGTDELINKNLSSLEVTPSNWEGAPYYWTIRNAQLDILQNRNFTIPERMLILGYYSMKADEYVKKSTEKISEFSKLVLDNELCRSIADSLKTSQSDESAAAKCMNIIAVMTERVSEQKGSMRYSELVPTLFDKISEKIKLETNITNEGNKKRISFNFDRSEYFNLLSNYRKIENERAYIIENVLVNTVFCQPLHKGIWANYFSLAVFYNLLKICVPAFLEENYTDKDLALAISYSSKMMLNTNLIQNSILIDFLDHQSYDLPHAVFLIS